MTTRASVSGLIFAFDCFAPCHLHLHLTLSPPLYTVLDGDDEKKNYVRILITLLLRLHDALTVTRTPRILALLYLVTLPHPPTHVA